MRTSYAKALIVLGFIAAGAFLVLRPGQDARRSQDQETAAPLALPDLDDRTVSLESFKGKVVLLDFWATWCEPCLEELPALVALHEKYQTRGFSIIGVSLDILKAKAVRPFVQDHKIPYPVLLGGELPPPGYYLRGIPTAFLIDREGRIVKRYLGPQTFEDMARDVEELIAR